MSQKDGKSRMFRLAGAALHDVITGRLLREYVGPASVPLRPCTMEAGLTCAIASDLVTQSAGPDGTVCATRGYDVYTLPPGGESFQRVDRLPCPLNRAWAAHFSLVRKHFHRSDIADLVRLRSGATLAFSGGYIYRRPPGEKRWERVFKLRYWGPGTGRGVRPLGTVQLRSGNVLFGEYFNNNDYLPIHIHASHDDGRTWQAVHTFCANEYQHIHCLQEDPVTGQLWACTGDANVATFIAYSSDEGRSFHRIGGGSQCWRACKLLFTDEHVYWGADTNQPEHRAVFRWNRNSGQLEKLAALDGPVLGAARLAGGTWAMATDREGLVGLQWFTDPDEPLQVTEPDEIPSLWISLDGLEWKRLKIARWLPQARPVFGILQIAVGDGAPVLAVSCFNIEKYNGALLVVPEAELRRWY